jgi:hypothetical protein
MTRRRIMDRLRILGPTTVPSAACLPALCAAHGAATTPWGPTQVNEFHFNSTVYRTTIDSLHKIDPHPLKLRNSGRSQRSFGHLPRLSFSASGLSRLVLSSLSLLQMRSEFPSISDNSRTQVNSISTFVAIFWHRHFNLPADLCSHSSLRFSRSMSMFALVTSIYPCGGWGAGALLTEPCGAEPVG